MDRLGTADPYVALKISSAADDAKIKSAYRRRVLRCHPDKCRNLSPAEQERRAAEFKTLTAARDVLLDDETRERYDAQTGRCHRCPHDGRRPTVPMGGAWSAKCVKCQPVQQTQWSNSYSALLQAQADAAQQIAALQAQLQENLAKQKKTSVTIRTLKRKRKILDEDIDKLTMQNAVAAVEHDKMAEKIRRAGNISRDLAYHAYYFTTPNVYFTPPPSQPPAAGSRSTTR